MVCFSSVDIANNVELKNIFDAVFGGTNIVSTARQVQSYNLSNAHDERAGCIGELKLEHKVMNNDANCHVARWC